MKMLRSQGTIRCSALLIVCIGAGLLQGCSRDPNVKKAKYLKSGENYAAAGQAAGSHHSVLQRHQD